MRAAAARFSSRSSALAASVAVAVAVSFALASRARAGEPAALVARLERSAEGTRTLAGEFTQRSRIKLFKQELASRGRLYFARPSRMRWEYLAPDPSVLIVDGDAATMATPGEPPQRFDLAKDATLRAVVDQLGAWLGGAGLSRLAQSYDMTAAGSEKEPALVLVPKASAAAGKAFARIELRFDGRLLLHEIALREPSGDEKTIVFTRLERNTKLPPDAFQP